MKTAVLQSHLLSKHFKTDCEEAIRTILQRTGGKCPLCPNKERWTNYSTLSWSIFIHFSRQHGIADGLQFNNDILRQVKNAFIYWRKKQFYFTGKCGIDVEKVLPGMKLSKYLGRILIKINSLY